MTQSAPQTQNEQPKKQAVPRNGVDVPVLFATIGAVKEQPELAKFQFRATNRWVRGTHSRTTIESFSGAGGEHRHKRELVFDGDHPEVLVGADHGATPVEFLLHGLASCLQLLTPNWQSRLPGWSYAGPDPDGFMTAGEFARHLDDYARRVSAPVHQETSVLGVEREESGGYRLQTTDGPWHARAVVIATGDADVPYVPPFAAARGLLRLLGEAAPELADELEGQAPVGSVRGFGGHTGYLRQSHGPGWALVGDAGSFKDPITAHGITDALRDAELVAHAFGDGSVTAYAEYQKRRDDLSLGFLRLTDSIASFRWTLPELQAMHRSLSAEMVREAGVMAEPEWAAPPKPGAPRPRAFSPRETRQRAS